jgi:riboflavin kinase/FMN adenylyltransferase
MGYTVEVIPQVNTEHMPVSSSLVRSLLREGNVTAAAELLGRWYGVSGPVVHGDGRGRSIGIPSANVDAPAEMVIPGNGVYATWAILEGQRFPAVTNIGLRPTFISEPTRPRIEALLLDVDRDLYGKELRVEFVGFIRPEQRFASVQELLDQIERDRKKAREVLAYER